MQHRVSLLLLVLLVFGRLLRLEVAYDNEHHVCSGTSWVGSFFIVVGCLPIVATSLARGSVMAAGVVGYNEFA